MTKSNARINERCTCTDSTSKISINNKQKASCIFCQNYPVSGVFALNVDTPNFEGIYPHCNANFIKKNGHTYPIHLTKNNFKSRIILSAKNNTNWWRQWCWKLHGKWMRSYDLIRPIRSFKKKMVMWLTRVNKNDQ